MPERCIGFGERDHRAADPAKHCTNDATTPAGLWCPGHYHETHDFAAHLPVEPLDREQSK